MPHIPDNQNTYAYLHFDVKDEEKLFPNRGNSFFRRNSFEGLEYAYAFIFEAGAMTLGARHTVVVLHRKIKLI